MREFSSISFHIVLAKSRAKVAQPNSQVAQGLNHSQPEANIEDAVDEAFIGAATRAGRELRQVFAQHQADTYRLDAD